MVSSSVVQGDDRIANPQRAAFEDAPAQAAVAVNWPSAESAEGNIMSGSVAGVNASIRPMLPDPTTTFVHVDLLPYEARLDARPASQVDLVVIHCTELPDLAMARRYGEEVLYPGSQTGNSGHYYLDRDGAVHQYVSTDRVANHTRGYNPRSIGIELVNRGRYPDWLAAGHQAMDEAYTEAQMRSLIALLLQLQTELPALKFIAGHEDLDTTEVEASDDANRKVRRKRDPGPLFPWQRVLEAVALERMAPAT